MKLYVLILFVSLSFSSLNASACFTAVNGFKAVGELTGELSNKVSETQRSLNSLGDEISLREEKNKIIADLQKKIRQIQVKSYIKSKQILHNLKIKNQELSIESSLKSME